MILTTKNILTNLKKSPPLMWIRKKKYEHKFTHNRDLNLFKGIYSNYEEAQSVASQYTSTGYDNKSSAQMYKNMCNKIFPEDYPTLYWINRLNDEVKVLLDYGGHVGIKRYAFDKYLPRINNTEWKVYDLPKVKEEAVILHKEIDPKGEININFQDSIKKEKIDLFLALGSFQYIPKEVDEVLAELGERPKYLLIRVPLTLQKTFVTLNHIGTTVCPYIIRNEQDFLNNIEGLDYELIDKWVSPNKVAEIPFHHEYSVYGYTGHLFKRKD